MSNNLDTSSSVNTTFTIEHNGQTGACELRNDHENSLSPKPRTESRLTIIENNVSNPDSECSSGNFNDFEKRQHTDEIEKLKLKYDMSKHTTTLSIACLLFLRAITEKSPMTSRTAFFLVMGYFAFFCAIAASMSAMNYTSEIIAASNGKEASLDRKNANFFRIVAIFAFGIGMFTVVGFF